MLVEVWRTLITEVAPARAASGLASAWAGLAQIAQEENGMMLPEVQLPLLAHHRNTKLLSVHQECGLLLAMPLVTRRLYDQTAEAHFTCTSLPLVARSLATETVHAFLHGLRRPILFKDLPIATIFYGQIQAAGALISPLQAWQRACLRIEGSYDAWLEKSVNAKRRGEFRRQRNRLAELGKLTFESLGPGEDFTPFVNDYIALEAKGWKGKRGTAMLGDAAQEPVFHDICKRLHATRRLRFYTLRLDGKAIATVFALVFGTQGQTIKITYDEKYAKYSPGVLLVLEATRAFFAEPGLRFVDSCAMPNHPMIDRLWRDRMDVADVLVAPAHYPAWRFRLLSVYLQRRARLRGIAKKIYFKIAGRTGS